MLVDAFKPYLHFALCFRHILNAALNSETMESIVFFLGEMTVKVVMAPLPPAPPPLHTENKEEKTRAGKKRM